MAIKLQEILDAVDFVNANLEAHQAYLCMQSGKIYWHVDGSDLDEPMDELPEDIGDDEKYLAIPDKRELDLGTPLVFAFAREVLPGDLEEVEHIFSRRGAYARFKDLLARRRALEQWYQFEQQATEQAVREWCALNSIVLDDDKPGPAATIPENRQA
jgi:hypothetical protein